MRHPTPRPFDVTGTRNDTVNMVAPRTLDGPIRITTEGGYAQIAGRRFRRATDRACSPPSWPVPDAGAPANGATAGGQHRRQTIVLTGQGFTNSTLVQFLGIDDSGTLGTLTRTGYGRATAAPR